MASESKIKVLVRGLCLSCPRCGARGIFQSFWNLRRRCPACRLKFEREQGYFVGAIYLNYAATVSIVVPGYFLLDYFAGVSLRTQLLVWGSAAVIFPIAFFPFSKGLWLGLGYMLSSEDRQDATAE
ncbi:MAG TPA: DUF983 domain-containing protein [Candidatus Acidoferrales bacterium]|nr:DUF983 domain-containing protein [Candidatus Acidoferrales bacterium]